MRILAIRGCNLASLAGEFEVDLARAPLGGAGVFAIVGNTGAGKSTLLDAMCVALFDRTPRLGTPSRVQVGRGPEDPLALGATDVRTLLRRGASTGWAEVDFESGDARRYRARWAVRRARGHSDGALQDQQVSLVSLDSEERLGGTKTETLKTIQQRLGLTFDQFRRSALLAQGEFAAFLRADGKDRSELLERMTGTDIYSRLSIAAHLRAARAELELRDRRGAAHAIAVLDADARATRGAELAEVRAARRAARARLGSAEAAARWLAESARRDDALGAARADHGAAVAAVAAADAARDELAVRRRAEALRPTWDAAARTERELAVAVAAAASAAGAAEAARAARAATAARRVALAEAHAPIRAARLAAGIVERPSSPKLAVGERAPAARGAATGRGDEAIERRAREASVDAAWLVARAALAPEIAAWPELDGRIAKHAATAAAIDAIDRELADRARDGARLGAARDAAAREHAEAVARLEAAQRKAAAFHERRSGLTLDAARRAEDAARARCGEVDKLVAIADAARVDTAAREALAREVAQLEDDAARDEAAQAGAAAARDAARGARDEAGAAIESLRRIAGYAHERAELVAGDPCPLCGATEHPWQARGELSEAIGEATARRAGATARHDAAAAELAAIDARAAQRAATRARSGERAAALDGHREARTRAWRSQLAALGELPLVDDPAAPGAAALAAERAAAAAAAVEAARGGRTQVEAGLRAATDAQQEALARTADVEHAKLQLDRIADEQRALAAVVERHAGERSARAGHRGEIAAAIGASLARWESLVPGARTVADSAATVADPGAAAFDGVATAPAVFARARIEIAAVVEAWVRAASRVAAVDGELAAADGELARLASEAERAAAEAEARRGDAEARRATVAADHAAVAEALAAARTAAGFGASDGCALRELLAASPARAEELAQRLDALARAVELAAAVVGERARHVADHAAARPPDLDGAPRVAELAREVAELDELAARLAAELAADDDAAARRAGALADLARAESACEVDRVLGDVIGSHDGKLFRSFAQSLTLDGLLAVANSHLEELAPRYQLERVPRHDLELQVIDRDLGNEIRSVQSLSGGESFLVSLALALGLSSMSAHDVRVRTLLIDEGFGTLDPATLDTALAVLDRLQATGRQVGVISHVPALVERVGAHVRVVQRGNGRSEVVVAG